MIAIIRTASYALVILFTAGVALAQERPYFVTYDDHVEERGELELSVLSTSAKVKDEDSRYFAPWIELEYGVITEASRIQKEIVGRGPLPVEPIRSLAEDHANELEGRLILSSWFGNFNVSENFIAEKNLSHDEGVEFGYTVGVSWPLKGTWDGECRFCAGALTPALEVYGGLGTTAADASGATRQFVAPVISWHLTRGSMLRASTAFGLTSSSDRFLLRVSYTVELD